MEIVLNLQFLTCKKHSKHRSTVNNCNFSKLQFFKCTFTVIPLHIFAVYFNVSVRYSLNALKTQYYYPDLIYFQYAPLTYLNAFL